jgi:hypothetical protein
MTTRQPDRSVTRRTALAALGAGSLTLAASGRHASAQEGTGDLAGHPLGGTWLAMTPGRVIPAIFGADGSVVAAFPANYVDPAIGLTFKGPALGTWAADGDRRGHFTAIQALSDGKGTYVGTWQFEGHPEVSADGQTFSDSTPQRVITRDAANNIISDQVIPVDPPVTATRIGATVESVVLPVATPAAATPTT